MVKSPPFEWFLKEITKQPPPGLRIGQHAFNLLYNIRPNLANSIRGTDVDPFYGGTRAPAGLASFIAYCEEHWEDYE